MGTAFWRLFACGMIMACLAMPAGAAFISLTDSHNINSGWSVSIAGAAKAVSVVDYTPPSGDTVGILRIHIDKDFGPRDINGEFPVAQLDFLQTLPSDQSAGIIEIVSETVANNSLVSWSGFRWSTFTNVARFNKATSDWDALPFQTRSWQSISGDLAGTLVASNGLVLSGSTFAPSGSLDIDVHLPTSGAARFTLKETVVPEPTTILLLLGGFAVLLRRPAAGTFSSKAVARPGRESYLSSVCQRLFRRRQTLAMSAAASPSRKGTWFFGGPGMRFVCVPILLLAIMATTASASLVVELMDPFTLRDSGWSMTIPDDLRTGVTVDAVTSSYIHLEISKEFYAALNHDPFTPNVVTFTQQSSSAVSSILITDESILNGTGHDWTSYHWMLEDPNAAFDKTSTVNSGFSIAPFTTMAWGPTPTGWASSCSHELAVSDGTLQDGDVYYPGLDQGWLAIKVNLDQGPQPVMREFNLMQAPIPEPVTMSLLLIGGAMGVLRRNRR